MGKAMRLAAAVGEPRLLCVEVPDWMPEYAMLGWLRRPRCLAEARSPTLNEKITDSRTPSGKHTSCASAMSASSRGPLARTGGVSTSGEKVRANPLTFLQLSQKGPESFSQGR